MQLPDSRPLLPQSSASARNAAGLRSANAPRPHLFWILASGIESADDYIFSATAEATLSGFKISPVWKCMLGMVFERVVGLRTMVVTRCLRAIASASIRCPIIPVGQKVRDSLFFLLRCVWWIRVCWRERQQSPTLGNAPSVSTKLSTSCLGERTGNLQQQSSTKRTPLP